MCAIAISDVSFRTEVPADVDAIRAVAAAAFSGEPVGALIEALRASPAWEPGLSFVAEHEGRVVGHISYTHNYLDARRRLVDVLVLSPLGVLPTFQRRGIGSLLVRRSLEALATRSEPLVFLEGVPGFYPRFGFQLGHEQGFRSPSVRIPDEAFMVKRLPAFEPWMTGALVYADPFWRLDCVGLRDADGASS